MRKTKSNYTSNDDNSIPGLSMNEWDPDCETESETNSACLSVRTQDKSQRSTLNSKPSSASDCDIDD